jgi:hypothetical protein
MSYFHSLIPFLPLFCNCEFWRLDSIQFLCSQAGRLASRNSTPFFSTEIFFITTFQGPHRKVSFSIVGKACLQRRCIATKVYSIVACVFVVAGICLPSCCLAMNVYSDFAISALGRSITIFLAYFSEVGLCDLHAVCLSVYHPLLTFECLNHYLLNLVCTSWHPRPYEQRTSLKLSINLHVCTLMLLGKGSV